MTFDEAIKKADSSNDITGEMLSPGYDNFSVEEDAYVNGVNNTQDYFENVINELRETYAPTIEMTEAQKNQLLAFKEVNSWFSVFIYKQSHGGVPAFSESITPDREDELIRAWLNPELIKVVD